MVIIFIALVLIIVMAAKARMLWSEWLDGEEAIHLPDMSENGSCLPELSANRSSSLPACDPAVSDFGCRIILY
jgi:hypothetical protein